MIQYIQYREYIIKHAAKHRLPAIYFQSIKGAKPADLPVERPVKFNLVVNLKTAKQLGIAISPTILYQATEMGTIRTIR